MTKDRDMDVFENNEMQNCQKPKYAFSEPNSRTSSLKKKRRHASDLVQNDLHRNSLQLSPVTKSKSSSDLIANEIKNQFKRVRSFKLTSDGLLNDRLQCRRRISSGSSVSSQYRSRLTSDASIESSTTWSCSSSCSTGYYRIQIMGAHGVGKTALENRFMSSEYMSSSEVIIGKFSSSMPISDYVFFSIIVLKRINEIKKVYFKIL